jgi:predicted RND superfamily exporter protein
MLQKFTDLIMKRPMKIIIVGIIVFIGLLVGVTQVELKTGNETMIQTDTTEYIDNFEYQNEFGSDPIIIIYKGDGYDNLFTVENITLMAELEAELSNYDEIFSINSPVSLVKQFAGMQAEQYETALLEVSTGLEEISINLEAMSVMMLSNGDTGDIETTLTNLTNAINQMITGQENLGIGVTALLTSYTNFSGQLTSISGSVASVIAALDGDPAYTDEYDALVTANQQIITMATQMDAITINSAALPGITTGTIQGLEGILINLTGMIEDQTLMASQLTILANNLSDVASNLHMMSVNLGMIHSNFNVLVPSIPTEQATLDLMIYDEFGEVRSVFESFAIDDQYMMFLVVLDGNISDETTGDIVDTINETLVSQEITDSTLVSGKPVLDMSIKSEMMGSMQIMMGLSAIIMILVLLVVFRVRWSLLPLAIILFAVIATIGIMGWLGIGLTLVSMAVFPVLIGLGIDYSIQFQSRYTEELAGGMNNE